MRSLIRGLVVRSLPLSRWVVSRRAQESREKACQKLSSGVWKDVSVLRPEQLRAAVRRDADVCHVVATGWSVNESLSTIDPSDFVIGLNFSALANIHFDLYTIEVASPMHPTHAAISALQAQLVLAHLGTRIKRVAARNLWMGYVDPVWYAQTYGKNALFIGDYPITRHDKMDVWPHVQTAIAEQLVREDADLICGYGTSTIKSIAIAYRLGFKRIVVHGLDGRGPYFFTAPGFTAPSGFDGILAHFRAEEQATASVHVSGGRGLRVIGALREAMAARDVVLLAGCQSSPVSQYLELFDRQSTAATP